MYTRDLYKQIFCYRCMLNILIQFFFLKLCMHPVAPYTQLEFILFPPSPMLPHESESPSTCISYKQTWSLCHSKISLEKLDSVRFFFCLFPPSYCIPLKSSFLVQAECQFFIDTSVSCLHICLYLWYLSLLECHLASSSAWQIFPAYSS